ncbi:hypothetical protein TCON_0877 [Astathelohania contejeani]|uniref:BZIP domain-containing protein n=1 Tax=Astathelohania contejeani TaxID=164912 RepID=A0ABQ7I0I0_9MICR|nr:hypothetical protein TCON_0877 [Thelohania contejeani]
MKNRESARKSLDNKKKKMELLIQTNKELLEANEKLKSRIHELEVLLSKHGIVEEKRHKNNILNDITHTNNSNLCFNVEEIIHNPRNRCNRISNDKWVYSISNAMQEPSVSKLA